MNRFRNHRRRAAALPVAAALVGLCLSPTLLLAPFAAMPAPAYATEEDPQPAPTSTLANLAGLKLPANALRVPAGHALARDARKQITELAKQSGVSLTGKNELLLWPAGEGYKSGQRTAISQPLGQTLTRAGLTYKEVHTQKIDTGTLVVFLALRPDKQSTGVLGMWVASDDSLLLEWADAAALQAVRTTETTGAASATETRRAESSPPEKTLRYEPARVQLVGRVRRQVFAGPPNYQSVERGDRPEPGWVLDLEQSVSVVAAPGGDEFNQTERNVRQMQMVLTAEQLRKYAPLVNRCVQATGTLFHAHTGHHHTPVLLAVADLRLQNNAKRPPTATQQRRRGTRSGKEPR